MAVDITVQQMALTRDTGPGGFMERVTAMMAKVAGSTLTEAASVPYHMQRAFFAQKVVQNPSSASVQGGPQVVMGVNVIATTTYDEQTKTSVCTIADIDLESQIETLWNSLAGIDTPS
jgi:hypothetical protein